MIAAIFEVNVGFIWGFIFGLAAALIIMWVRRKNGHYGGIIKVEKTEKGKTFTLELNHDPQELDKQKEITFKIESPPE